MSQPILANYNQRHKNQGFTLLEVLISVALVSVVMMLIWQTTSQSVAAKKRIEARQEIYHYARVAIDKIVQDLTMAVLLKGGPHLGTRQGAPLLQTVFVGSADRLHFASLSHLRLFQGSRESEGTEIGYQLAEDPDHREEQMLLRREAKGVDSNPEEGGAWIPIAKRVRKFEVEYYDGDQFDWKTSWNSENTEKDKLPRAVRLVLVLADPARKEEKLPFTTTVLIGMYKNGIEF